MTTMDDKNENATPWSWQQPPLPPNLLLLGGGETRHSDIWFRRFWGLERGLATGAVAGVPGQCDIILSCQISVPLGDNYRSLDIHAVKRAVKALRFDQPTIASQCAYPNASNGKPAMDLGVGRLVYQVPRGEAEVEEWLSQVVIDREAVLHTCNSDLDQAIDLLRQELGTVLSEPRMDAFHVHFVPSSGAGQPHAIVLLLGHVVFDAVAAVQIMCLLLSKIAETIDVNSDTAKGFAWGEEVKRLAKPFPDRSVIPWSSGKTDEDLSMMKIFQDPRAVSQTAHALPIPNLNALPSTTGAIFKTISSTGLSRLMRTIRKQQCSMFCVLLATSVISTLRINPPKACFEDITTPIPSIPLNLRTNCLRENEDVKDKWQIISAFTLTIFFAENLGRFVHTDLSDKRLVDDIFTLSKEFKKQLDDQQPYMPRSIFWLDDLIESLLSGGSNPGLPIAIPNISSLGIMDANLPSTFPIRNRLDDAVRISNLRFSVRNPYPPNVVSIFLHAYTWQDVLHLAFSYPEAYMGSLQKLQARENRSVESEGNMMDYVEKFMNILDTIIDTSGEFDDSLQETTA